MVRQSAPMNGVLTIERARRALAATGGERTSVGDVPTAAVAAVLRDRGAGLDLLFIRRAEHPRDPWSGHMAWPGGHIDDVDSSPLAAALRETREELQLDLARDGELLGGLPVVRTHLRRGPGPRHVAPFVFALHRDSALVPNHEVQETVWVPLAFLGDRRNRARFIWMGRGVPLALPCYRYEGRLIWGLTLHMLDHMLRRFGDPAAGTGRF
jgi:8-oxo-dGTP pyrophosphatase MutT (NUDIX family)